jgi:DNA gyrase/topoisomerase IV subunit A
MDLVEMKFATSFAHVEHSHLMTSYFMNKEDWSAGAPLTQKEIEMGENTAASEDVKVREHKEELNQKRASLEAELKIKEEAFAVVQKELLQLKADFDLKRLENLKLLDP